MISEEIHGARVDVEIRAESRAACEIEIDAYLRRFHPWGYGTDIQPPMQRDDGTWVARGRRQRSAD